MKFRINLIIDVDEEENILPVDEDSYNETLQQTIEDLIYDVDGMKINNIKVSKYEETSRSSVKRDDINQT